MVPPMVRMLRLSFVVSAVALAGCAAHGAGARRAPLPEVKLELLTPGVWLHTSHRVLPGYGLVSSNGLVLATEGGAVLIDTAWGKDQTEVLIGLVEEEVGPLVAVVVTHFHDDRTAGLAPLHARGVPSYSSRRTAVRSQQRGGIAAQHLFSCHLPLEPLGLEGEVFFPGRGHTHDNVVVWLAGPRVLFGGCLVKSADAESLGNTADADLAAWPGTIERLWGRYERVRIVVPGHGRPGTRMLLAHTRALVKPGP